MKSVIALFIAAMLSLSLILLVVNVNSIMVLSSGEEYWGKLIDVTIIPHMDVDVNGSIYFTGNYIHDILLIKLNSSCDMLWAKEYVLKIPYQSPYVERVAGLVISGNMIYIAGSMGVTGGYDLDTFIAIINKDTGEVKRILRLVSPLLDDYITGLAFNEKDKSIYVLGEFYNKSTEEFRVFIAKINTTGNIVWVKILKYIDFLYERAVNVYVDEEGYIYATGIVVDKNNNPHTFIAKIDSNGNILKNIILKNMTIPTDMVFDPDGYIYIDISSNPLKLEAFIIKMTKDLEIV